MQISQYYKRPRAPVPKINILCHRQHIPCIHTHTNQLGAILMSQVASIKYIHPYNQTSFVIYTKVKISKPYKTFQDFNYVYKDNISVLVFVQKHLYAGNT